MHLGTVKDSLEIRDDAVMVRVHSSCATGDIWFLHVCDCGDQYMPQ
ncbi:MAG: hypothetical protein IPI31_09600 [Bacteroidetes bacterium]|nr:hypothetical protein [Bacteroidota bacterium]